MTLRACILGVVLLSTASAATSSDFSFRGSFSADDDVAIFSFAADGTGPVVFRTYGYAGGVQADGTVVAAGGLDPVIEIFDAQGVRVDGSDDGTDLEVATDTLTGSAFDVYLTSTLSAGTYTVAIVQYDNHALGPTLIDGAARSGVPAFTSAFGCGYAPFCDQSGHDRTSFWALDIRGVVEASIDPCAQLGGPSPTDSDGDGIAEACDNCPDQTNPSQADLDDDEVGDECDNCTSVPNPRVAATWLAANPWAVVTGGQRDDDRDGFGNKCDAKFVGNSSQSVGGMDLAEFRASNTKSREGSNCGTGGSLPCAIFDLDEGAGQAIGGQDLARFRALNAVPPGPKCPTCPLTCEAGAQRSCEP